MTRRFIGELGPQETVNEVFVASNKQLRPNRNGNLYLQVDLTDRSGAIPARMWNANESVYRSFDNGDYVRVEGTTQLFQGAMQMIATRLTKIDPAEIDEDEFIPEPTVDIEKLVGRLREMVRGMTNPHLQTLIECFLVDEEFMNQFTQAPAGVKNHHAYLGGLLDHVVALMDAVVRICPCYPQIDRDLLLTGAFLHDLGKTRELGYDREMVYTDEGQLIGHLVMAVEMLDVKVVEAEKLSGESLPKELVLRLKHMILSHHGDYEFGSPKLPMTLEAVALSLLDNLDAKINAFDQLLRDDPNTDSAWTNYFPNLNRKLYKGLETRG